MREGFELKLFGVPEILDSSGISRRLRAKKQLSLLVYLSLEGRDQPVPRDLLAEMLWEGVPIERARHSLEQAISAIRGLMGGRAITRVGSGVRLSLALATDLDVLGDEPERLDVAHPLAQLDEWAGTEFAHWVERARARCLRLAEQALRESMARHRRNGETERVHRCAQVLYEIDELSDLAVHALAERELLRGDVIAAIRLLRDHIARVRDALGCMPQKDTERLLRRLEAGAHPPVELVPPRMAGAAAMLRPAVFVAREHELAQLEAEWESARTAGFQACLVEGPGGIGKSALVRRFAATLAARAQPVFLVSCQEIGEGIPFAAISDVVMALARDPSVSGTDPKWLAEVSRVHPGLRSVYPGIPEPPPAPAESIRLRVAEGVLHMLDAVADGGPVAIVFDDLQFMDPATRDVLHVLARRLEGHGVLLVATSRVRGLHGGLLAGPLGDEPLAWHRTLRLGPLERDDMRVLLTTLVPSLDSEAGGVHARILELAEGNPHFAEMLVQDWRQYAADSLAAGATTHELPANWSPPDSMRQAFAGLYRGVDALSRHILHVLAVARRSLGSDEIAGVIPHHAGTIDAAVWELLDCRVLRLDRGALSFKNELHRAFVYYAMDDDLRMFLHGRLGRALLSRANDTDLQMVIESAHHFVRAGEHERGAQAVLRAAPVVVESGAPHELEAALRAVLTGNHPVGLQSQLRFFLGKSLSAQGKYPEAVVILETLTDGTGTGSENSLAALVLVAQARQRARLGEDQSIAKMANDAVRLAQHARADSLLAVACQTAAEVASESGDAPMLAETLEITERLVTDSRSPEVRVRALFTKSYSLMVSGAFGAASNGFVESARGFQELALDAELAQALNGQGICLLSQGRHPEAIPLFANALRLARKRNDAIHEAVVLSNLGVAYEDAAMFRDAAQCYAAGRQTPTGRHAPRHLALAHANAANLAIVTGDFDGASERLSLAREYAKQCALWRVSVLLDLTEADLLIARGETELAWPLVSRAIRTMAGRERALDTNGKAIRLGLHYALASHGAPGLRSKLRELRATDRALRLADRLEVEAFVAWAERRACLPVTEPGIAARIEESGLLGVLAMLGALYIFPDESLTRELTESGAEMVERAYPASRRSLRLPTFSAI
jgi:DNA-binding SARP family transcriptional activator/tetratricopeptide (TPR) repeat protein